MKIKRNMPWAEQQELEAEMREVLTAGMPKVFAAMVKTANDLHSPHRLFALATLLDGVSRGVWTSAQVEAAIAEGRAP